MVQLNQTTLTECLNNHMSEQEQSVSQKTRVQWMLDSALVERAELHAIKQGIPVRQCIEELLSSLPAYKITEQPEASNAAA